MWISKISGKPMCNQIPCCKLFITIEKLNKMKNVKNIKGEDELFKLFGQYARYLFGGYVIDFNGKTLSAKTPSDLFERVKKEYNESILRKAGKPLQH